MPPSPSSPSPLSSPVAASVTSTDTFALSSDYEDTPGYHQTKAFAKRSQELLAGIQAAGDIVKGLRTCVKNADRLGATDQNKLIRHLARRNETQALIGVWDIMGGSAAAEDATWTAILELHALGKKKIRKGYIQPPDKWLELHRNKRTLSPARRLHKICKPRLRRTTRGQRLAAQAWVASQRMRGRDEFLRICGPPGAARQQLARELQHALKVPAPIARGLVTNLKRKQLI